MSSLTEAIRGLMAQSMTKAGLQAPGQDPVYFDSPDAALAEGNRQLQKMPVVSPYFIPGKTVTFEDSPSAAPAPSLTDDGSGVVRPAANGVIRQPGEVITAPKVKTTGGDIEFKIPDYSYISKYIKPTVAQATAPDPATGMPTPVMRNPALTKMGKFVGFLGQVAQGAMAGQASAEQAVAQSGGHRGGGFGAGFTAGVNEPYRQAAMQQQIQRGQLENEVQKQQAIALPWLMKNRQQQAQLDLQKTQADIDYSKQHAEYLRKVAEIKESPNDKQIHAYVDADGKQRLIFQKADGSTYERAFGDVNQKENVANSLDAAWLSSFRKQYGREPNAQEINGYQRSKAQATHITVSSGGSGSGTTAPANESEIEIAARQLVQPDNLTALKNITSWRGDQRLKVFAKAKQLDPNFDAGLVDQRIRFLQSYEDPKGRAAINRQAINNILQHAGDLQTENQNFWRAGMRVANTPINAIRSQFGDETYTRIQLVNTVLKDELSLYFAGGYAPSKEQQGTWDKILSDNATPGQVEAFAKEVVKLGLRRATTFNGQFKKMMGYSDPNMIIPEAMGAANRLGLGGEASLFESGGQYGHAAPAAATGSSGSGKKRPPLSNFER
jgi:hypothetical protein